MGASAKGGSTAAENNKGSASLNAKGIKTEPTTAQKGNSADKGAKHSAEEPNRYQKNTRGAVQNAEQVEMPDIELVE
jgi:hypothetical protein